MKRWKDSIIYEARDLRKQGYSYGQLVERFSVAKSTLHYWIVGVKRPEKFYEFDKIRWAKFIQPMGALVVILERDLGGIFKESAL